MGKWKHVRDIKERFWAKIDVRGEDECWLWKGAKNRGNMAMFWIGDVEAVPAHRYMLEIMGTPVESSIDVLRTCGDNLCCNPKHFEIQTEDVRFRNFITVDDETGCWNWGGFIHPKTGYGMFVIMGKNYLAHRHSYQIHKGKIPDGMDVCHICNNRRCVNPDHLYLGTPLENMGYMVDCGRQAIGEKNGNVVLTKEKVIEIKQLLRGGEYTHKQIAEMFGCKRPTISDIAKGKTWSWVKIEGE